MIALAAIVMIAWIPAVLVLFMTMKPLTALLTAMISAWLFLPMAAYKLAEGLPIYDKTSATCLGILISVLLFDFARLRTFSLRAADWPMLIWCVCPFFSSVANGLGAYDGASTVLRQVIIWGLPYLLGRIYFTSAADVALLAKAILIGGVIYVPLCLWEIRMSPQLHAAIYGFSQHDFAQTVRFGGFRPMVFMQHGLMVGMWMCMASLIGIWLRQARALRQPMQGALNWLIVPLLLTAILCKSSGAIVLMLAGLCVLQLGRWTRSAIPLWCLIVVAPLVLGLRVSGVWSGDSLVSLSNSVAGADRAQSLKFRLDNEDQLTAKAMQRPLFGWGGWGRARIYNDEGADVSVTDGLWIIALGNTGIVGLAALTFSLLMPAILICRRLAPGDWLTTGGAGIVALGVVSVLSMIDNIPNAMVNPIFTLSVGAVIGAIPKTLSRAIGSAALQSGGIGIRGRRVAVMAYLLGDH